MASPVSVASLQAKSHDMADEVRTPDKTRVEVVHLDGVSVARLTMQPGWRWSECVRPVVGTDQCDLSHVGYAIAGSLRVRMEDGAEQTIKAGDSYTIPPGHDAWVVGDAPFIGIEVMSADHYARA